MKFSDISELKKNIDIVDYIGKFVDLKFNGKEYVGLCPFHKEKTPSFYVNKEKNIFHCFGCGAGNDIIDFTMKINNMSFNNAVKYICEQYGAEISEKPTIIRQINRYIEKSESKKRDEKFYLLDNVMDEYPRNHNIEEWIAEGISYDVLCKHDVRYDSEKTKIVFPVFDEEEDRKIISLKVRTLLPDYKERKVPKYIYTNKIGRKDFLYWWKPNERFIKESSECILVEAEKSQMKLESYGVNNVVAVGSHAITDNCQRFLLKSGVKNIVFAYDKDVKIGEIMKQITILKHYCNCFILIDKYSLLGEKDSPIDRGIEVWNYLYDRKEILN